jgi:hypothetical protein
VGFFGRGFLTAFDLRNRPGRVDEPRVAEGLWEVTQELSADGIDFLGEKADVIDERQCPFEHGASPCRLSGDGHGLRQPERAQEERPFLSFEPVLLSVAVHEPPLVGEAFFGRLDGGQHSGLVGGQESDQ